MKRILVTVAVTAALLGTMAGVSTTDSVDKEVAALRADLEEVRAMPRSAERLRSLTVLQVETEQLLERHPNDDEVQTLQTRVNAQSRAIHRHTRELPG